jgi:hypothetical protein
MKLKKKASTMFGIAALVVSGSFMIATTPAKADSKSNNLIHKHCILWSCSDYDTVDPMYQYSGSWLQAASRGRFDGMLTTHNESWVYCPCSQ